MTFHLSSYSIQFQKIHPDVVFMRPRSGHWIYPEDPRTKIQISLMERQGSWTDICVKVGEKTTEFSGGTYDLPKDAPHLGRHKFPLLSYEVFIGFPNLEPVHIFGRQNNEEFHLLSVRPRVELADSLYQIMILHSGRVCSEPFKHFVETGTMMAHTSLTASFLFQHTWSIEIEPNLHERALATRVPRDNLTFLKGDSAEVLAELVPKLDGPTLFFLDGHWSGDDTVDWKNSQWGGYGHETGHRGEYGHMPSAVQQVPLMEELNMIFDNFPHPAIIVIDDWNSVGEKDVGFVGADWTHLKKEKMIERFSSEPRTKFQFAYDPKQYVLGIRGK